MKHGWRKNRERKRKEWYEWRLGRKNNKWKIQRMYI